MAFCTKCGRPLQDDEVCSCQTQAQAPVTPIQSTETASQESVSPEQASSASTQASATPYQASISPVQVSVIPQPAQPNAFAEFLKLLWTIVLGVLRAPVTSINTYVEKADVKVACALIGLYAIVEALITWFGYLQVNSRYYVIAAGFIFKQGCYASLSIIAAAAVVALIIMITVNAICKTKVTYVQGIAIASLTAILLIPAAILSYVFGLIDVVFFAKLANWVKEFASAVGAIYIFFGVRVLCKDENKLPLISGLCAVGSTIAIYLINMMFS